MPPDTPYNSPDLMGDKLPRDGSRGTLARLVDWMVQPLRRANHTAANTPEDPWLARYKAILASLLPDEFIGVDGLLRVPADATSACTRPECIVIIPPKRARWWETRDRRPVEGAFYRGGLSYKLLRRNLFRAADMLPKIELNSLRDYVTRELEALPAADTIDLTRLKRPGSLAHEVFHDIQGYLLDYWPDVFDRLHDVVARSRQLFERWYANPETAPWRGPSDYQLHNLFPASSSDSPYGDAFVIQATDYSKRASRRGRMSQAFWDHVYPETMKDMGRIEAIPLLLAASTERDTHAIEILSCIFGEAGLRDDFHFTLPRC